MKEHILTRKYKKQQRKKKVFFAVTLLFLLLLMGTACCLGVTDLTSGRIFVTLFPGADQLISASPLSEKEINVLLMLRMPRVAAGVVAGAGLGVAGAAMQAITGNQMASPFTTGLSGASAFGAALVIMFGTVSVSSLKFATVLGAFGMAVLCAVFVYGLASYQGLRAETLVLTGIALNYLFSAMNSTLQYVANENQLPAIIHWTFGSLNSVQWGDIGIMAGFFLVTYPIFQVHGWAFNLLDSGNDETAKSLGVSVKRTRLLSGLGVTLLTASVVSFTGIIGFVGLVAPHIARLLIGGDYRYLLPFSAVLGAILVTGADTVGRVAFSPTTLPVGIVVSYVGVPLFLYLILRERRRRR